VGGGGAALPGRELPAAARLLALRETLAHLDRLAAAGRAGVRKIGDTDGFVRRGSQAARMAGGT
jgi:hypothetical protein